jgi:hypothetical protein
VDVGPSVAAARNQKDQTSSEDQNNKTATLKIVLGICSPLVLIATVIVLRKYNLTSRMKMVAVVLSLLFAVFCVATIAFM